MKGKFIMRASPGFNIVDMVTTIEWYEHFLGFECTFCVPGESIPPYAIVEKDNICIHLSFDRTNSLAGTGFCYIETENIDELYETLNEAGVIFVREIENSSYGMRDFVIKDYEGNKINFSMSQT